MEERCITDHVHIRMLCTVFTQTLHGILMCFRLSDIECDLMFKILPAICHSIVHMNRIPDNICQKADCIFMERFCIVDADTACFLIVFPFICGYHFPCGSVDDFPPAFSVISCIYLHQFIRNSFH